MSRLPGSGVPHRGHGRIRRLPPGRVAASQPSGRACRTVGRPHGRCCGTRPAGPGKGRGARATAVLVGALSDRSGMEYHIVCARKKRRAEGPAFVSASLVVHRTGVRVKAARNLHGKVWFKPRVGTCQGINLQAIGIQGRICAGPDCFHRGQVIDRKVACTCARRRRIVWRQPTRSSLTGGMVSSM